ncbi:MAG: DUF882 domain-containing protein [Gammaproteobacteria bacterium]
MCASQASRPTDCETSPRALGRGGVGYYRKSDFVHVDTARVRYWEG